MDLEQLKQIIENNGFTIASEDVEFSGNETGWELQQYTPEGEDWYVTLVTNNDVEQAADEIIKYAQNFDVDEEVEPYIEMRGRNGTPSSIADLLADAQWKQKTLENLAADIQTARANAPVGSVELENKKLDKKEEAVFTFSPADGAWTHLRKAHNEDELKDLIDIIPNQFGRFSYKIINNGKTARVTNSFPDFDDYYAEETVDIDFLTENKKVQEGKCISSKEASDLVDKINTIEDVFELLGKYSYCLDYEFVKDDDTTFSVNISYYDDDVSDSDFIGSVSFKLDDVKDYITTLDDLDDLKNEISEPWDSDLYENKRVQEADGDENDDVPNDDDDTNTNELDDIIEEWETKSPLHERVISEIIEDSNDYNGKTKLTRIRQRLGDIAHGLSSGIVGTLVYYSDTVAFYNEYEDDIYDVIDELEQSGLEPLEALKSHHDEVEIIMQTDDVKNSIVWLVYEEIAYEFDGALEEIEDTELN